MPTKPASNEKNDYHLTYKVDCHTKGITAAQVKKLKAGACDAVMIASMIDMPDGGLSTMFFSRDGKTSKPLDANGMFKVWTLMAAYLRSLPTLDEGRRGFADDAFKIICAGLNTDPEAPRH